MGYNPPPIDPQVTSYLHLFLEQKCEAAQSSLLTVPSCDILILWYRV